MIECEWKQSSCLMILLWLTVYIFIKFFYCLSVGLGLLMINYDWLIAEDLMWLKLLNLTLKLFNCSLL